MKKAFLSILTAFLLIGCGMVKKINKRSETEKTTEITREKTSSKERDSSTTVIKTLPTLNELKIGLTDIENLPDFEQTLNSGNGNVSTIKKRGNELIVENAGGGTESENTKVSESEENTETEFRYDSEYVINESKKIIRKIPWWFWVVVIVYFLRKPIWSILVSFIPFLAFAKPKK